MVYDGAPKSGKTESIRALGGLLKRPVETPEEINGRTLLFDWMEYRGGRVNGRPLHCRVVTVPGQVELAKRRATILAAADVVIFVMDATSEGLAPSLRQWGDLQRQLKKRNREIPVFVQINKQDLPQAISAETVRQELGPTANTFCKATVATKDEGIRETFVLAVGTAIKSLAASGMLKNLIGNDGQVVRELEMVDPVQLRSLLDTIDPREPKLPE